MKDIYINSSKNISYDAYFNISSYNSYHTFTSQRALEWIVICTGFPLTLIAIAAVYSLIRKDHVAPVYIINLLISDLIQLCCLTAWRAGELNPSINYFYYFGLMASVGFMVCISFERYLLITQPVWYRYRRNIKTSVVVCAVVWILPLVYVLPVYFTVRLNPTETIFAVFLLLPLPLFIFFLVGTIKALSAARSVPADEKRRIVAILVVVLLIYTLLFLPNIVWSLVKEARNNQIFHIMSFILLKISPLADLTLYVFIRKSALDKLLVSVCCKMSTNQQKSIMTNDTTASCGQIL